MTTQKRNKIQNIYLNDDTHQTIKKLAAHQDMTIQGVAAFWLEQIEPVMAEMVVAFDDIKNGKDTHNVLQNLMAKGLRMASDNLTVEEEEDVTDNGKSD